MNIKKKKMLHAWWGASSGPTPPPGSFIELETSAFVILLENGVDKIITE